MIEQRKNSLLNTILSGETPDLNKALAGEMEKYPTRGTKLGEIYRKTKSDPPRLIVNKEANGARVLLQPYPPTPKFETVAFVANSGKITYYKSESSVKPEYKAKIERLSKQAAAGKKISR